MFYRSLTDEQTQRVRRARPVIALAAVAFAIGAIVGANGGSSSADSLAQRSSPRGPAATTRRCTPRSTRARGARSNADEFAARLPRSDAHGHRHAPARRRQAAQRSRRRRARAGARATRACSARSRWTSADVVSGAEGGDTIAWSRSLAFPGLRAGETLSRAHDAAPAARRCWRATVGAGRRRSDGPGRATRRSANRRARWSAKSARSPARAARRWKRRRAVRRRRRHERSGARARRAPARHARRRAAGRGSACSRAAAAARRARRAHERLAGRAARGRAALGSQLGGVVALARRAARSWRSPGIGMDSVQPPGSTFKMITLTGVLESHVATPQHRLPLRDVRDARRRQAEQRQRRGMRRHAGARLRRLVQLGVRAARRQARRAAPGRDGRTLRLQPRSGHRRRGRKHAPAASSIQGELDVGSTAIGQGQVQASALQMAIVAATIADGGRRPRPTFTPEQLAAGGARVMSAARRPHRAPADDRRRAQRHRHLRGDPRRDGRRQDRHGRTEEPVHGSGERRGIERIGAQESSPAAALAPTAKPSNTDAWFASFAPALKPRIVVGVLLVKDGAGGDTAAPVAREVLEAGATRGKRALPGSDVELRRGRLGGVVRVDDLQLQRAVVERDDLDLEQQQRALRGAVGGDRVGAGSRPLAGTVPPR